LRTQVLEVSGSNIGFNLGRKEGVHIDDRYVIGEMVMNSKGELSFQKDGFARVSKIGDNIQNPRAMSYGYGVIVGDWAPGMTLIEYPTLSLDIYGMLGTLPLSSDESGVELRSDIAIAAEMAYNIGQIMGQPHWYLTAGGALGNATYENTLDTLHGGIAYIDVSVLRRFQMRRLDAFVKGGAAFFTASLSEENSDNVTFTYDNEALGAVVGGGFNLTLNISMALGLRYSYYFGGSDVWTVKDDDDIKEIPFFI